MSILKRRTIACMLMLAIFVSSVSTVPVQANHHTGTQLSMRISPEQTSVIIGESAVFNARFTNVNDPSEVASLSVHWEVAAGDPGGLSLNVAPGGFSVDAASVRAGTYTIRAYALDQDLAPTPYAAEAELTVIANDPQVNINTHYVGYDHYAYRVMVREEFTISGNVTDRYGVDWPDAELEWTTEKDDGGYFAEIWDDNSVGQGSVTGTGRSVKVRALSEGTGRIIASVTVGGATYSDSVPLEIFHSMPYELEFTPLSAGSFTVQQGTEFEITLHTGLTSGGNLPDRTPRIGPAALDSDGVSSGTFGSLTELSKSGYTIRLQAKSPGRPIVRFVVPMQGLTINNYRLPGYPVDVPMQIRAPLVEIPGLEGMLNDMEIYVRLASPIIRDYIIYLRKVYEYVIVDLLKIKLAPYHFYSSDTEGLEGYTQILSHFEKARDLKERYPGLRERVITYARDLEEQGYGLLLHSFINESDAIDSMYRQLDGLGDAYAKEVYNVDTGTQGVYEKLTAESERYMDNLSSGIYSSVFSGIRVDSMRWLEEQFEAFPAEERKQNLLYRLAKSAGFLDDEMNRHLELLTGQYRYWLKHRSATMTYFKESLSHYTQEDRDNLIDPLRFIPALKPMEGYATIADIRSMMRRKGDNINDREVEMVKDKVTYQDRWRIPLVIMPKVRSFVQTNNKFKPFENQWLEKAKRSGFSILEQAIEVKLDIQKEHYARSINQFLQMTVPYLNVTEYEVPFHTHAPGDLQDWSLYWTDRISGFFLPYVPGDVMNLVSHGTQDYDSIATYKLVLPRIQGFEMMYQIYQTRDPEEFTIAELEMLASVVYSRAEVFSDRYYELKATVLAENIGWIIANVLFDSITTFFDVLSGDFVGVGLTLASSVNEAAVSGQQGAYTDAQVSSGKMQIKRVR